MVGTDVCVTESDKFEDRAFNAEAHPRIVDIVPAEHLGIEVSQAVKVQSFSVFFRCGGREQVGQWIHRARPNPVVRAVDDNTGDALKWFEGFCDGGQCVAVPIEIPCSDHQVRRVITQRADPGHRISMPGGEVQVA